MKNKILISAFIAMILILIGGVHMAHNKVYAVCENMCMEETYTKEQINEKLNNIAVITGTITKPSGTYVSDLTSYDYPAGFTNSNSVVISAMSKPQSTDNWTFGEGVKFNGSDPIRLNPSVRLGNNKVFVSVCSDTEEAGLTFDVKIVLMKIS